MSKKSNKRGGTQSRHARDLQTLRDAPFQRAPTERNVPSKEVVICTVDDIRGKSSEAQTPRENVSTPEVPAPLDPLLIQLREDTQALRPTRDAVKEAIKADKTITPDMVFEVIRQGLRGKERG